MTHSEDKKYDLAIVGGGIVGTAVLYTMAHYTDVSRVVLFEKHHDVAAVNSRRDQNSQTLHVGDIETNYSLEKALAVRKGADLLKNYMERHAPGTFRPIGKMVLAVGAREVADLEKRYEAFKKDFPKLRKLGHKEIGELEPNVVEGRHPEEPLLALATEGYAVDFGAVSSSFVAKAMETAHPPDIFKDTEVVGIESDHGGYKLKTARGIFFAKTVLVAAGPESLVFAKRLGYGKNFGILPVAGNFYGAKNVLRGKVYMMQIPGMPFAAVHGDPDVAEAAETRFGPTIRVLPLLERHNYRTVAGFLRTSAWSLSGVLSLLKLITDPVIFRYLLKNIAYDIPFFGKSIFVKWELRKIVPSLRNKDVSFLRNKGGIRPQVVDTAKRAMEFGTAEVVGEKIIFAITPSPGASVCLGYAVEAAKKIVGSLDGNFMFDEARCRKDLRNPEGLSSETA